MAVAVFFQLGQAGLDRLRNRHIIGTVDFTGDGAHFFSQRHRVGIQRGELRLSAVGQLLDRFSQFSSPLSTICPMGRDDHPHTHFLTCLLDEIQFGGGIARELIDRHHRRHAKLFHIRQMPQQVWQALLECGKIFPGQLGFQAPPMQFERLDCRHHHGAGRFEACFSALYVEKLLRAQVGAKPRLCHDILRQFQSQFCRHDGIAAMGDIPERSPMDQGRIVF